MADDGFTFNEELTVPVEDGVDESEDHTMTQFESADDPLGRQVDWLEPENVTEEKTSYLAVSGMPMMNDVFESTGQARAVGANDRLTAKLAFSYAGYLAAGMAMRLRCTILLAARHAQARADGDPTAVKLFERVACTMLNKKDWDAVIGMFGEIPRTETIYETLNQTGSPQRIDSPYGLPYDIILRHDEQGRFTFDITMEEAD